MLRNVALLSGLIIAAAAYPLLSGYAIDAGLMSKPETAETAQDKPETVAAKTEAASVPTSALKLEADERGHFHGEFKLNGRKVTAMIDTGATVIAMNKSIARRAGIALKPSDFTAKVSTANGLVSAANIRLDSVEIGRIKVRDLQAVVIDDKALTDVLIGMNFLQKLKKFEVRGTNLLLAE